MVRLNACVCCSGTIITLVQGSEVCSHFYSSFKLRIKDVKPTPAFANTDLEIRSGDEITVVVLNKDIHHCDVKPVALNLDYKIIGISAVLIGTNDSKGVFLLTSLINDNIGVPKWESD